MKVAIGADHAGFDLKAHLVMELSAWATSRSTSAPTAPSRSTTRRSARPSAEPWWPATPTAGIVLGGSGQGEQIAANKVHGVRAALCNDLYTARLSREHNDANVLAMGGRIVANGLASEILELWLATPFEGGRHERRVAQIADIENEES